jgi:hypothetical protein
MRIKKNDTTGGHYVSILVPPDRAKRVRYAKVPLVPARKGFIGFIVDMLRGGPNPFLASPIATSLDRQLKIEKQAKGVANSKSEAAATGLITQIDAALDRFMRESFDRADEELDQLDRYVDEEEDYLENCRPTAIQANLETELDKVHNDVNGELGPIATSEARARVARDNFVGDNELKRTLYWGKPVTRQSIYLILGITAFEFLLNTAFFSGTQRSGIIGGAALAMLLSVTTIILGVAFGITFQFSNTRSEGRGWFGRLGAIILLFTTVYYLLLLTLARLAGESGDTHMFAAAAREIQVHPFSGLLDLPALAYFFFSVAVIAGVFYKFIDTMGHFPRIRSHWLSLNRSEKEFEEVQFGLIDAARSKVDESLEALEAAPGLIQLTTRAIHELVINYENVVDQFRNDMKDIKDAARLLVGVVCQHTGLDDDRVRLTIDYGPPLAAVAARLDVFRQRTAKLESWDEINSAAVDKCRHEMTEAGRTALREIEARCDEVRQERYRDLGGTAPPLQVSAALDNVAWLSRSAS